MAVYFRTYQGDFSYEFIFTEGRLKKRRIHILINPGKNVKLPRVSQTQQAELNPKSLTHLVAMITSVVDEDMLKRTVRFAEQTNKPIITNKKSAFLLKEMGISVKQMRILGFEEEVIDNLRLDPVYKEELEPVQDEAKPKPLISLGKQLTRLIDPRKYLGKLPEHEKPKEIDVTNPLALLISVNKQQSILLPLDNRGVKYIQQIANAVKPWAVLLPDMPVSETFNLHEVKNAIFLDSKYNAEDLLSMPRSNNPGVNHQTYQGGFDSWYEIPV